MPQTTPWSPEEPAKEVCDDRMERSLYHRGVGYSHEAGKVFLNRDDEIVEHKYIEHYPPDPTSMIFFLKNRRPDRWGDSQNIDGAVGHYIISEKPYTEEQWIKEHASNANQLELEASLVVPQNDGKPNGG